MEPETFGWNIAIFILGLTLGLLVAAWRGRQRYADTHAQVALLTQERNFLLVSLEQLKVEHLAVGQQLSRAQDDNRQHQERAARLEQDAFHATQQMLEKNAYLAYLQQQIGEQNLRLEDVVKENTRLQTGQLERDAQHLKQLAQLEQQKHLLAQEFQNIANRIFEEKGQHFAVTSKQALEQLLLPFREQMTEFRQRVDTIHKENNEATSSLRTQLVMLKDLNQQMTADAQNLTRALKGDKKLSGSWGEVQLERSLQLAGLLASEHYQREAVFEAREGGNKRPDFVLKLPDGKHMVLDSKVSLVDYDAALAAESDELQQLSLDAHVRAVKRHIDQLALRDYTNLIGIRSPNFVVMFMPVEPAFIEALRHGKDVFNYGYDKNVILVSHTTLMPILRTVANLWMIERGNLEAREISGRAGEIYNHLCLVAERLLKLGRTLSTANSHYNETVRALAGNQGLFGKVDRFKDLASNVTKQLPVLEPSYQDIEFAKLEAILGLEADSAGADDDKSRPSHV